MIDPELRKILGWIRKRPGMFFGSGCGLLPGVYGFINGYCFAKNSATAFLTRANSKQEEFFPSKSFTKYLQDVHGFPGGIGWDWKSLIENRHGNDAEGFEAFFDYLNQFQDLDADS